MRNYLTAFLLSLFLGGLSLGAQAQKVYQNGIITTKLTYKGSPIEGKSYFTADSSAFVFSPGPAQIRLISDSKDQYMALLVNVAAANVKKAAVATPADIEKILGTFPKLTFKPGGSETKIISGFTCKKVIATEMKHGKSYDIWVTNDISVPKTSILRYYKGIDGIPIQYVSFDNGVEGPVSACTVTAITNQKPPAGIFSIPADFERISFDELGNIGKGH